VAVSRIPNNRLLNAWQRRMANPFHFNQLAGTNAYAPLTDPGEWVYVQPDRDYIAEALAQANAEISAYLGTYHRPTFVEEVVEVPRNWRPDRNLFTQWNHVQAIGSRATTLIEAGATVTYNLAAGTATVTVATTVAASEVRVYFRVADGADSAANPLWEIEPLRAVASGGNVTLTGHAALFAEPSLWAAPYVGPNYNATSKNVGDSNDVTSYVVTVDVYREYADATDAVTFFTDPIWVGNASSSTYSEFDGVALIADGRQGALVVRPSSYGCNWRWFNRIRIRYLAGYPLDSVTGLPDNALETAYVRLGNCRIPQYAGNLSDARTQVWQEDTMVDTLAGTNGRALERETPFGYRRGEVAAWRTISRPPYYVPRGGVLRGA
jgi:hypothetical protein